MCGDLEEYDPVKHHELIVEAIREHLGEPSIGTSSNWAQEVADLGLEKANQELLAHFVAMGTAVSNHRAKNERLESIAQMAQIHAYLSGILSGVLLDDGTLQQIGLKKFLEGIRVGRAIDVDVASDIAQEHGFTNKNGS